MPITRKTRLSLYALVIASIAAAVALLAKYSDVTTATEWFASSDRYKAEVMAQPPRANGELRHIEWGGWGWAGPDTTVYLVFDPTDSLSAAAKDHISGKFKGIPCEIVGVHRLEANWYKIQFYTNEFWGRTNALNCSGAAS